MHICLRSFAIKLYFHKNAVRFFCHVFQTNFLENHNSTSSLQKPLLVGFFSCLPRFAFDTKLPHTLLYTRFVKFQSSWLAGFTAQHTTTASIHHVRYNNTEVESAAKVNCVGTQQVKECTMFSQINKLIHLQWHWNLRLHKEMSLSVSQPHVCSYLRIIL